MEGKQFITRIFFLGLHFVQKKYFHFGEEVVSMPAKKRKVSKKKVAKKSVKKTTKKKATKKGTKKTTSKKGKKSKKK